MNIDVSEAFAVQPAVINKVQYLFAAGHADLRQYFQQSDNFFPIDDIAACDLSDDKWMYTYIIIK